MLRFKSCILKSYFILFIFFFYFTWILLKLHCVHKVETYFFPQLSFFTKVIYLEIHTDFFFVFFWVHLFFIHLVNQAETCFSVTYKNQAFHSWPLTFALAIQVYGPVFHKIQIQISKSTKITNIPIYLTLMEPNLNSPTPLLKVFKSKMFFVNLFQKDNFISAQVFMVYLWRSGRISGEMVKLRDQCFVNVLLKKWTNFWKKVSLEKANNLWRNVLLEKWINIRQNLLESCLKWILDELSVSWSYQINFVQKINKL